MSKIEKKDKSFEDWICEFLNMERPFFDRLKQEQKDRIIKDPVLIERHQKYVQLHASIYELRQEVIKALYIDKIIVQINKFHKKINKENE